MMFKWNQKKVKMLFGGFGFTNMWMWMCMWFYQHVDKSTYIALYMYMWNIWKILVSRTSEIIT